MNVDIGRVFSNTLAMIKDRWLTMVGLWAAFLGLLIVYIFGFSALLGQVLAGIGASLIDPTMLQFALVSGGFSAGLIIVLVLFWLGYMAIFVGQYSAMVASASPLQQTGFGDAFARGLKGALTLIAVGILLFILYLIFALILALVGRILALLGPAAGILLMILLIPAGIYIACRFSMLIPAVVVEKVYNPIKAIDRSWEITKGKVLGIFLTLLAYSLLLAVVVVPSVYGIGALIESAPPGEDGLRAIFVFLFMLVLYFAVLIANSAMIASLHAEISDTQATEFSKAFE